MRASDATGIYPIRVGHVLTLEANIEGPAIKEVVLVPEALMEPELELPELHLGRIAKQQQSPNASGAQEVIANGEPVLILIRLVHPDLNDPL